MHDLEELEPCASSEIHDAALRKVQSSIPNDDLLYDLADFFKMFADSTRIKILFALMRSEMCVCDLAALVGTTASAISHQLRGLKQARLLKSRREGKSIFYGLADDHVYSVLEQGMKHICE